MMDNKLEKPTTSGEETQDMEATTIKSENNARIRRTNGTLHVPAASRMENTQKATRTKTA
jgi:hypothetical protein